MTALSFPAHRLCSVNNPRGHVLAVSGSHIQTLSLDEASPVSIWPRDGGDTSSEEDDTDDQRPSKRIKLGNGSISSLGREASELSEASIEIKTEGKARQKGERRRPKIPDTNLPNVSHLITTSDGTHAIAITAEDKAVRVFRISQRGKLNQLSSRCMPKKSCAIALSPDEQTILTADKFGDVYAIALHPPSGHTAKAKSPEIPQEYKPSASELTVHTKGNLEALRQQLANKQKAVKKEGPSFEYKLLLGHVSLLTDLATATGSVDGKPRPFILTADRDEHIRVSRGLPQTHIIHTYCSGHTEFVSKLFIVPWNQKVLIAGNGEPSLRVYDWQAGKEMSRFDILEKLRSEIDERIASDRPVEKIAVSGIWDLAWGDSAVQLKEGGRWHNSRVIAVALEALPILLLLELHDFELRHVDTLRLKGNVLDVLFLRDRKVMAVSVDTVHKPGSCKDYRDDGDVPVSPLEIYEIAEDHPLKQRTDVPPSLDGLSLASLAARQGADSSENRGKNEKFYSPLGELIYGLENLRKRRGKADEEEDEAAQDAEAELAGAPSEIGS